MCVCVFRIRIFFCSSVKKYTGWKLVAKMTARYGDGEERERKSEGWWWCVMVLMKIGARIQKWNLCLNIDWHMQVLWDGYRLNLIGTRTTKDGNINNAISIKNKQEWIININMRYSILASVINWMRVLFVRFVLFLFFFRQNSIGLLTDSFISINLWRCMWLSACIHIHVYNFFFLEPNGSIVSLIVWGFV